MSGTDVEGRWPSLDDKAFVSSPPCYGASTAEDGQERLWRLVRGYRKAADLLVRETEISAWERRDLIYPIVFNYRHSIELAFKKLIENHGCSVGQAANFQSHNLDALWPKCRFIMEHYNPGADPEPLEILARVVQEFSEIDPKSVLFRYALDRNGVLLESKLGYIDLVNLRNVMAGIHNFLECVDWHINEFCER